MKVHVDLCRKQISIHVCMPLDCTTLYYRNYTKESKKKKMLKIKFMKVEL
jgi:hypothetical protein